MSLRAAKWAEVQVVPDKCALVLRTICLAINDKPPSGVPKSCAWPGHKRIAERSNNMSISTVKRSLKDLQKVGLIGVHKVRLDGHICNAYTVNLGCCVRWDRGGPWPDFVRQAEAELQSKLRLPGESKAAFAQRTMARLVPVVPLRTK